MAMSPYSEDDLRHPEDWEQVEGIRVSDADGWRNTNTPWDQLISYEEFLTLAGASTVEVNQPRYTPNDSMRRLRAQTNTLSRLLGDE